ncbi:MAG: putative Ig domain-containing protein [Candidatus Eisenbacteria bacterium]
MRSRIIAAAVSFAGLVALLPSLAFAAPNAAEAGLSTSAAERATAVSAPEISAPALVQASSDQSISITATATDADLADILTITATGGPAGLTLAGSPGISPATATLSGTLGAGDVGSYFIDWTVSSLDGTAAATTNLQVAENANPAVTAPASVTGAETSALTFAVSVSDADGDEITSFTASGLPAGATFTPNVVLAGGQFAWTPPLGAQGSYSVTFDATSGSPGRIGSATTAITIGPRDRAPTITGAAGTVNGVTSVQIAINVVVSDADGDAINSLVCRGTQNTPLPAGAVFTPNVTNTTGAFRWTPTPAQSGTVTVDFIAESGATNLGTTVVTKIVVKVDRAPVVTAPASVAGTENVALAFTVTASDPDATPIASLSAAGLPMGASFTPNGTNTSGAFAWTPDYSQAGSHPVVFTASNALSGSATTTIAVANVDRAPVVTAPASIALNEGDPLAFTVTAADPDADAITELSALGLPVGATFTIDPSNSFGEFAWTPGFADAGVITVQFRASNALLGSATTMISVGNLNRAPLALDGGPYTGVAGIAVSFNGSGSSDPDGDVLTYSWNFGDGGSATGATPTHIYAAGGLYTVVLTVADNGTPALSDNSTTSATITAIFATRLFTSGGGNKVIRLGSGKPDWCLQLEAVGNGFVLSDPSISSLVLQYGGNEIHAVGGKSLFSGDTDNNGVDELSLCFSKSDLRTLLASLPSGRSTVTLTLAGSLNSGALIAGSIEVDVFGTGGALAASVSPNPLNPEATLSLITTKAGSVRVRLYDASGRFVRMLADRSNTGAGYHDIRIDGRDQNGARLATGVYFYRAETPDGAMSGRFTILK